MTNFVLKNTEDVCSSGNCPQLLVIANISHEDMENTICSSSSTFCPKIKSMELGITHFATLCHPVMQSNFGDKYALFYWFTKFSGQLFVSSAFYTEQGHMASLLFPLSILCSLKPHRHALLLLLWIQMKESPPLVPQTVKNLLATQETQVQSLSQENPLETGMVTHCSILAWRIPWTEEPGGLQSMGSQSQTWLSN